jgi:hypothetical protein
MMLKQQMPTADLRRVEAFLREWDPIGVIEDQLAVGYPPTEYDRYAPEVYALLLRGCSLEHLTDYLSLVRTDVMGLGASIAEDRRVAERILAWWQSREAGPKG